MIITISGLHGTGKSTIGKLVSQSINIQYYSTGQAFRDLAKDKNMSLERFTKYVENHPEIDIELDNKIIEKAKKGDIIIDSQLSGHLLKNLADFKILLTCPVETRIKRMTERDHSSYDEKLDETLIREQSELERFKKLYKIDLNNQLEIEQIYDLVINTENLTIDEVVEIILSKIQMIK